MKEEKIIVIEDPIEFFNKYIHSAKDHLLFYENSAFAQSQEFSFYSDEGVLYVCRGEKAKTFFGLMEGKIKVYSERITYEVAE